MRHEDYKQLLALEAVGALDEGERGALHGHLPACAECREELRELSDAAASLLSTVEPVPPGRCAALRGIHLRRHARRAPSSSAASACGTSSRGAPCSASARRRPS